MWRGTQARVIPEQQWLTGTAGGVQLSEGKNLAGLCARGMEKARIFKHFAHLQINGISRSDASCEIPLQGLLPQPAPVGRAGIPAYAGEGRERHDLINFAAGDFRFHGGIQKIG